jgi:hypothetical protein
MKKIILLSYSKLMWLFGAWMCSTNICEVNSLFCLQTTNCWNRLQAALLEHDFLVQYKKGTTMPADYLSRLLSFPQEAQNQIAAFDPFQHDLPQL